MLTKDGEGGVWKPPKLADIICDEPLYSDASSSKANEEKVESPNPTGYKYWRCKSKNLKQGHYISKKNNY